MKSPRETTPAKETSLQSVISILKRYAKKFRTLAQESRKLLAEGDALGQTRKLRDRAQLLVDLPQNIVDPLENVDPEQKQEILHHISGFATEAKEVLKTNSTFALGTLLTPMGDKKGDKNYLEELIGFLEGK